MSQCRKPSSVVQDPVEPKMLRKIRRVSRDFEQDIQKRAKLLIKESYEQLDEAIDFLDTKIKKRIDINNAKMLFAFQTHLDKVTHQLKLLKDRTTKNQENFSLDRAIINLTRQCTLFRQEAMRLSNQLEDAYEMIDAYKRKVEGLQKQVSLNHKSLSQKISKIKRLEVENATRNQCLQELASHGHNHQNETETQRADPQTDGPANLQADGHADSPQADGHANLPVDGHVDSTQRDGQAHPPGDDCAYNHSPLQINARQYQATPKRQILITQLDPQNQPCKKVTRQMSHRPRTMKTKIKHRQNSQMQLSNANKLEFFCNEKVITTQKAQQERAKTNHSVGSPSSSNCLVTRNGPALVDGIGSAGQEPTKQLLIFRDFVKLVNHTRQSIVASGQANVAVNASEAYQIILNQSSLLKFLRLIFSELQIDVENAGTGTQYQARPKNTNKSLAQLSSELMKKMQIIKTQSGFPQSHRTNKSASLTKNDGRNLQISTNQQTGMLQTCKSVLHSSTTDGFGTNEKRIKKIDEYFSKKTFTKKQRQKNYINHLSFNK